MKTLPEFISRFENPSKCGEKVLERIAPMIVLNKSGDRLMNYSRDLKKFSNVLEGVR